MRRPGAAAALAVVALVACGACTRADPAPKPPQMLKPGQVVEILPDGIRPPASEHDPKVPFFLLEPVALLPGRTPADIDLIDAESRGSYANVYRLHTDASGATSVALPTDTDVDSHDVQMTEVSSAARSADGTTWLIDNPTEKPTGLPRVFRSPPGGPPVIHAQLTGLQLSRDRVRLTALPDGTMGYLAGGRLRAVPGQSGSVPGLAGVERLTPTGGGGYLAALRRPDTGSLEVLSVARDGTRSTRPIPATLAPDRLRGRAGRDTPIPVPAFRGSVVALTPDGSGGAFLAVANEAVDDALGIDVSAASMLVHMDSDGTTTWLATGVRTDQDVCPRLRQPAPLSRSDLLFGRISDLVIRGDRLWLGDAGCRRILAVQLNGA